MCDWRVVERQRVEHRLFDGSQLLYVFAVVCRLALHVSTF